MLPPPSAGTTVYTLADSDRFGPDATWLGVLGQPIRHSLSPVLHHAALAEMAKTNPVYSKWQYVRFEVPPTDLTEALGKLHTAGFRGLNLTIPHKVLAVAHVVRIDPAARLAGAVNTLRWTPEGWEGFNTDGFGLSAGLKADLGAELAGSSVVLLGAGGAARGAAVECIERGCAQLFIGNRTPENLAALLNDLRPFAGKTELRGFDPKQTGTLFPKNVWIINATSAGLREGDPSPLDLSPFSSVAGVYDMIYRPPQTALMRQAASLGIPHANGLSMLIHQGARSLEIWTGEKVPVQPMIQAVKNPSSP